MNINSESVVYPIASVLYNKPSISNIGEQHMRIIQDALTFDDVLLLPRYSKILPSDTDISLDLAKNIKLDKPYR